MPRCRNLTDLSDEELLDRLYQLVGEENEVVTNVIKHLGEVDDRKLYLREGYSSLFDYVTRGLGYSSTAAMRRIKAARALVRQPRLSGMLERGEVSLSSVDICADVLASDDGEALLGRLCGKSKEEAEKLVAEYRTPSVAVDKIKLVVSNPVAPKAQQRIEFHKTDENSNYFRCGSNYENGAPLEREKHEEAAVCEERYQISFTASARFVEKLARAQQLLFTGVPEDKLLENVLEETLDVFLERKDPKERQKRREEREARKAEAIEKQEPLEDEDEPQDLSWDPWSWKWQEKKKEVKAKPKPKSNRPHFRSSRRIPLWLRDAVLKRDGYACTWSHKGVGCGRPWDLEIDHIIPVAHGGETEMDNLRVLCRAHNLMAAEDKMGEEFIRNKIEQRRKEEAALKDKIGKIASRRVGEMYEQGRALRSKSSA